MSWWPFKKKSYLDEIYEEYQIDPEVELEIENHLKDISRDAFQNIEIAGDSFGNGHFLDLEMALNFLDREEFMEKLAKSKNANLRQFEDALRTVIHIAKIALKIKKF